MSVERDKLIAAAKRHRAKAKNYAETARIIYEEGRCPGYYKRYRQWANRELELAKECERRAWRVRP